MADDDFNYDDMSTNPTTKSFYCGVCNCEMTEKSRRDSVCPKCGKEGWNIVFQCPKCGKTIQSFRQDFTNPPFCYCDNP
jgi:predicted RNA-binding Zn-ribbon protein involved in translation (DUF1610 family)